MFNSREGADEKLQSNGRANRKLSFRPLIGWWWPKPTTRRPWEANGQSAFCDSSSPRSPRWAVGGILGKTRTRVSRLGCISYHLSSLRADHRAVLESSRWSAAWRSANLSELGLGLYAFGPLPRGFIFLFFLFFSSSSSSSRKTSRVKWCSLVLKYGYLKPRSSFLRTRHS